MAWDWFAIKAVDAVMAKDTPDETLTVDLGSGDEIIRFLQGFSVGIVFRGFLLFPNMNDRNPFTKNDEVGAMIHEGNYWVGVNRGET